MAEEGLINFLKEKMSQVLEIGAQENLLKEPLLAPLMQIRLRWKNLPLLAKDHGLEVLL